MRLKEPKKLYISVHNNTKKKKKQHTPKKINPQKKKNKNFRNIFQYIENLIKV